MESGPPTAGLLDAAADGPVPQGSDGPGIWEWGPPTLRDTPMSMRRNEGSQFESGFNLTAKR